MQGGGLQSAKCGAYCLLLLLIVIISERLVYGGLSLSNVELESRRQRVAFSVDSSGRPRVDLTHPRYGLYVSNCDALDPFRLLYHHSLAGRRDDVRKKNR